MTTPKHQKGTLLSCTVKKPVDLYAEKTVSESRTKSNKKFVSSRGVSIIDITFPNFDCVDIGEITFKNNYTGFLSLKLKCIKDDAQESRWMTCLKTMQLMPDVHCDVASQDFFTIPREQILVPPDRVTALRLVLRQPSTVWANFGIENVAIREYSEEIAAVPPVVDWLEKYQRRLARSPRVVKSSLPADEIAAGLQRLWALTAKVQESQTETSLGRFDVDGSYEVNLLSYT